MSRVDTPHDGHRQANRKNHNVKRQSSESSVDKLLDTKKWRCYSHHINNFERKNTDKEMRVTCLIYQKNK